MIREYLLALTFHCVVLCSVCMCCHCSSFMHLNRFDYYHSVLRDNVCVSVYIGTASQIWLQIVLFFLLHSLHFFRPFWTKDFIIKHHMHSSAIISWQFLVNFFSIERNPHNNGKIEWIKIISFDYWRNKDLRREV